MLQPLIANHGGREVRLACVHWRHWPPTEAFDEEPVEVLRKKGFLDESRYARYLVWQRVCNLTKMQEAKCRTCPHVRLAEVRDHLPCLVTLDGKLVVPLVDRESERLARGTLVTGIRFPVVK